jgi:hypothetical protein
MPVGAGGQHDLPPVAVVLVLNPERHSEAAPVDRRVRRPLGIDPIDVRRSALEIRRLAEPRSPLRVVVIWRRGSQVSCPTPPARPTAPVLHLHFPLVGPIRFERFAVGGDSDRLRGFDLGAVPDVVLLGVQRRSTFGVDRERPCRRPALTAGPDGGCIPVDRDGCTVSIVGSGSDGFRSNVLGSLRRTGAFEPRAARRYRNSGITSSANSSIPSKSG